MQVVYGAFVAALCGVADAQTSIRYEFALEAVSNTTAATSPDSAFADIAVGATGTLSIEAITVPLGGGEPQAISFYPILEAVGTVDGIDLALDQSMYPGTNTASTIGILDFDFGIGIASFGAELQSLSPDLGFVFLMIESGVVSPWEPRGLPTSIDLDAAGVETIFELNSRNTSGDDGTLTMQVTSIDITVVPTPATSTGVCLGLLAFARRRRLTLTARCRG
ncbi:MAG: hypothetical protein ACTS22_03815 [Phycisphaerales bacterium]